MTELLKLSLPIRTSVMWLVDDSLLIPCTYWKAYTLQDISGSGIKVLVSNINSERVGQAPFIRGSALTIHSSLVPKLFGSVPVAVGLELWTFDQQSSALTTRPQATLSFHTI